MLFPFYFNFHIASEVRTSAINTRILPSEIVADINTDIPEAYSGYGDVISWTDDTGFRGATALVKLPLCRFPR